MVSGEPWGCALNLESGNLVVIKWYSMHCGIMGIHGVSWGIMGYHVVCMVMYGYGDLNWNLLWSRRDQLSSWSALARCPPGAFDLKKAPCRTAWHVEQRFPSSKAMEVGSQLFWDVIPYQYHTQSPPRWEPPGRSDVMEGLYLDSDELYCGWLPQLPQFMDIYVGCYGYLHILHVLFPTGRGDHAKLRPGGCSAAVCNAAGVEHLWAGIMAWSPNIQYTVHHHTYIIRNHNS